MRWKGYLCKAEVPNICTQHLTVLNLSPQLQLHLESLAGILCVTGSRRLDHLENNPFKKGKLVIFFLLISQTASVMDLNIGVVATVKYNMLQYLVLCACVNCSSTSLLNVLLNKSVFSIFRAISLYFCLPVKHDLQSNKGDKLTVVIIKSSACLLACVL